MTLFQFAIIKPKHQLLLFLLVIIKIRARSWKEYFSRSFRLITVVGVRNNTKFPDCLETKILHLFLEFYGNISIKRKQLREQIGIVSSKILVKHEQNADLLLQVSSSTFYFLYPFSSQFKLNNWLNDCANTKASELASLYCLFLLYWIF